ncbi:MAG: hypothetical protein L6R37_007461, partial [Teloschistes peruensis]
MSDDQLQKRRLWFQKEVKDLQRRKDKLLAPIAYPSYIPRDLSCNVEGYTMSLKNADFYSRRDQTIYLYYLSLHYEKFIKFLDSRALQADNLQILNVGTTDDFRRKPRSEEPRNSEQELVPLADSQHFRDWRRS